jgi:hypothetical protein
MSTLKKLSIKSHKNIPIYYPTKSLYSWECFQSIYPSTVSATLQLFYFLWCSNNKCFFSRVWKSKVEILFMLTSWVYLYFPLLSACYV